MDLAVFCVWWWHSYGRYPTSVCTPWAVMNVELPVLRVSGNGSSVGSKRLRFLVELACCDPTQKLDGVPEKENRNIYAGPF